MSRKGNSKTNKGHPSKPVLAKLTDAQSTIIATVITSTLSLIMSVISLLGTIYVTSRTQATSIELEKTKQKLQDQANRQNEVTKALGKAIESIQKMRDSIQRVINDPTISSSQADEMLHKSADELEQTFAEFGKDVDNSEMPKRRLYELFHKAKNIGLFVSTLIRGETKRQGSQLSRETKEILISMRSDLSDVQLEMLTAYTSLKEPTNAR